VVLAREKIITKKPASKKIKAHRGTPKIILVKFIGTY